ncbi:MAG: DUF3566 domain-containing protein [Mycobacterium sp.]
MTSPNEPGYPRPADGPDSANGSVPGFNESGSLGNAAGARGHVADPGDVPPWQRGAPARGKQPRPPREAPARPDPHRGGGPAGHSPGVDARLNRFISGAAAPASAPDTAEPPTRGERNEAVTPEAYASELPDLSGPMPRPPQRKAATDRSAPEPPARSTTVTSRVHVGSRSQGPVRASMQIRRIDPWSALKVSLVLSVALFFVWMIAVAFLYLVLGGMGVWSKLNSNVGDLLTSASGTTGGELVSSGTIFGGAALIGLVNIVLLTAMATVGVFIYNLTTDLVGGIEVTLADRD